MHTILPFLARLRDHNTREWFQAHKDTCEQARAELLHFVAGLLPPLTDLEPRLAGLEPKKCVFRIYRDVRFSKDKRPYKTHFGAWFAAAAREPAAAGYYLHLEPGNCFLAGGLWMPPADALKKIRQEIDYNGQRLHHIMDAPDFRQYFGGFSEEDKLKTAPKGYPPGHKDIEWLRLKSFTVSHAVADSAVTEAGFAARCLATFTAIKPLNDFLTTATT